MTAVLGVLVLTGAGCAQEDRSTFFMGVTGEQDLVGDWAVLTGGDYEAISLYEDGTYGTFLHNRPFDNGVWSITDKGLVLDSETYTDIVYDTLVIEEGFLFLQNAEVEHQWEPIE